MLLSTKINLGMCQNVARLDLRTALYLFILDVYAQLYLKHKFTNSSELSFIVQEKKHKIL